MKKTFSLLLVLLLCLTASPPLLAQSNRLYTIQHGMRTSNIKSLLLDSQGLIWISGESTIGYFCAGRFQYINNVDPQSGKPLFNDVVQMVEDKDRCFWVLTDTGLFYFNLRKLSYERVMLNSNETPDHLIPPRHMLDFTADGQQKLVLTDGYGQYVLDNTTHKVNENRSRQIMALSEEGFVLCATRDSHQTLWMARINHSLVRIDLKKNTLLPISISPQAQQELLEHEINNLLEVPQHHALYIATNGGILKYDYNRQELVCVNNQRHIPFTTLTLTPQGTLMAGSSNYGLWTVYPDGRIEPFSITDPASDLQMAKVRDVVIDRDGNLIVGLQQKGLYLIPRHSGNFLYTPVSLDNNGRNTSCITSLIQDPQGNYWIGTDGAGAFFAPANNLQQTHNLRTGLNSLLIQDIFLDKRGTLWVGSYGGGLQCCTSGTEVFQTPQWLWMLETAPIMALCYDARQDMIYVATNGRGVFAVNLSRNTCERMEYGEILNAWIVDLHMDKKGFLWVGDVDNVSFYNPLTGQKGTIAKSKIPGRAVCINSREKGGGTELLIGTTDGLVLYNPENLKAEYALQDHSIQSIAVQGNDIWVSTTDRLYRLDSKTHKSKEYKNFGNFFLGEFHKRSALTNQKGELLWGCDNGILSFSPKDISQQYHLNHKVQLANVVIGGKEVHYTDSASTLDASIQEARKVSMHHDDNSIFLSFGIPDFALIPEVSYEYQLEGYEKEWNYTTASFVRYSNLSSGNYTLRIRACIDGVPQEETERTLAIHVEKAWYETALAKLCYLLILALLIGIIYRYIMDRHRRKQQLHEALHNEEIKEAKLRLFTSIAHELRTPLTMIITPLRYLLTTVEDENIHNNLEIMQHNCNRLLNITRQITDIRKIDAGQFRLHFQEVNICAYIQHVAESFMGTAMVKKLQFTTEHSEPCIYVWVDPIHFEKILVNILSNAFKFTPTGGHILVRSRRHGNNLEISIYNEGSHIEDKDMEHLYERFYQANNAQSCSGSGIGLNLCHELIQLHHGTIEARNVEPSGVEFLIQLPLGCSHLTVEEMKPRPEELHSTEFSEAQSNQAELDIVAKTAETEATCEGNTPQAVQRQLPHILVVDDDKEICEYLSEQLQQDYNVTRAFGGNSAWKMVMELRPDAVITDVRMPDGDGIELARRIKSNPELDNTVVIMLTAESDDSVQLRSLQLSVDHFLEKPFNLSILKGALTQALRVRENARKHTRRTDLSFDHDSIQIESPDDKLFARIEKTLREHLGDSNYTVLELSQDVGLSRVHLNRKMKAHYGLSPNAFIRTFRLKQAAHYLVYKHASISDVAYKMGFSSHSHFTSSFREFFGLNPKEFVAKYSQEENAEALKKLLE